MSQIRSPCIRNCCLDQRDICLGCFRSIEEIKQWNGSSEQQQRQILAHAKARQQKHLQQWPLNCHHRSERDP